MHKLETSLANFRFRNNNKYHPGPYNVTWYVMDIDQDTSENVRCFSMNEMNQFVDYVVKNPQNFFGNKNYTYCEEDEVFHCSIEILSQNENLPFPKNIILRKEPLTMHGSINSYMNIILTDPQGRDCHTYNLNFNVVGQISS